jgi:hypothetical protein
MSALVRAAIVVLGLILMLGGLTLVVASGADVGAGLWSIALGALLVIVPIIERNRYRSESADQANLAPGPGGGEAADAPIEARFHPTNEVFVDPTTGHQMRVHVDPRTGERRYLAEA